MIILLIVCLLFPIQAFVKLNPKLQPMVDMIQVNRAMWEELHQKRQRSQELATLPSTNCDGYIGEKDTPKPAS